MIVMIVDNNQCDGVAIYIQKRTKDLWPAWTMSLCVCACVIDIDKPQI